MVVSVLSVFVGAIGLLCGVWALLGGIDALDNVSSRITLRERQRAARRQGRTLTAFEERHWAKYEAQRQRRS